MMTITRVENSKTVPFGTLFVGDTFLYRNTVGMIVDRNGHDFAIDLSTGKLLPVQPNDKVVPVKCSLTYAIK